MSRRQLPTTPAPDDLTPDEQGRIILWHCKEWPRAFLLPNGMRDVKALRKFLRRETDACLDYHRQHGNLWADWLAAVRNWIRRTHKRDGFAQYESKSSAPPVRGRRPFEEPDRMESIGKVLPLFKEGEG